MCLSSRSVFTFSKADLLPYKDIRIISVSLVGAFIEPDVLTRVQSGSLHNHYTSYKHHETIPNIADEIVKATCNADEEDALLEIGEIVWFGAPIPSISQKCVST